MTRPYHDLHQHIAILRERDLLMEVDRPIDKDSEMHPLVRWQFQGGMKESEHKAFLFTNIHDGRDHAEWRHHHAARAQLLHPARND
jgi:4-hydroxy-3-polyprenylbenzoate decarboxylase